MILRALVVALALVACAPPRSPPPEDRSYAMAEIAAMAEEDQAIQLDPKRNPVDDGHNDRITAVYRKNAGRLHLLLRVHGWPGIRRDGEAASKGAFLIVQHADFDVALQKEALPLLERAAAAGEAEREWVAYLTDRVRVNEGRPQVYGTQMAHDENGLAVPRPIEDEANVDRRRAMMGMSDLKSAVDRHRAFVRELRERMMRATDGGAEPDP